ncbi:MAG: glycosyl transferase, partial [Gemmatimonadota bacterium]
MAHTAAQSSESPPRIWGALLGILLLRLIFAATVPLVPDEAYYWTWSRHLAGGYFDHPPMIAWLIAGGTA